ncbi:hypothetical protein [Prauserella endophytica]|uniref:Uncharacterized protein n=1 Tax=Prauserella endophytica TaxID=1592324 RepID=A0ABY2RV06_9PSEU|nr:hypothetical protein [Prauserella endophytica]TKG61543.1 hypothetical protein FCN18_33430 [Prauserella endophytica]
MLDIAKLTEDRNRLGATEFLRRACTGEYGAEVEQIGSDQFGEPDLADILGDEALADSLLTDASARQSLYEQEAAEGRSQP